MKFIDSPDMPLVLADYPRCVITSHVNPDGDACGSTLALYHLLTSYGADVRMIYTSAVPENMRFLPAAERIEYYSESDHDDVILSADLLLCLDCNTPARLMRMEGIVRHRTKPIMVIDHHQSPEDFALFYRVDTDSSSTCELIWEIAQAFHQTFSTPLSKEFAMCCYTGIMTDTGGFRFPRTDAQLHRRVAHLLELGADPVFISESVLNDGSLNRTVLLGKALSSLSLHFSGSICTMVLRREWFVETATSLEDIEGFVNYTLGIRGVTMGIMFVEHPEEPIIKLSMRSKGQMEARRLAVDLGGGGHFHAAAARLPDTGLDSIVLQVLERLGSLAMV